MRKKLRQKTNPFSKETAAKAASAPSNKYTGEPHRTCNGIRSALKKRTVRGYAVYDKKRAPET